MKRTELVQRLLKLAKSITSATDNTELYYLNSKDPWHYYRGGPLSDRVGRWVIFNGVKCRKYPINYVKSGRRIKAYLIIWKPQGHRIEFIVNTKGKWLYKKSFDDLGSKLKFRGLDKTTFASINLKEAKLDPQEMDPEAFMGRWFMSKKKQISKKAIDHWAEKYPYKGQAFRVAKTPGGQPMESWCRTTQGLMNWKMIQNPDSFGTFPPGWHNYIGHITKGIDLVAMIKGEGLTGYQDTIVAVQEVTSVIPMTGINKI